MASGNPFGYTFDDASFPRSPQALSNSGPPLLNPDEQNFLHDFFSQNNPLDTEQPFYGSNVSKGGIFDYSWDSLPPANVHSVSTISNQAELQSGFHRDPTFAQDTLSDHLLTNTEDDLQAASTLYSNAQGPHANGRSYSMSGAHLSNSGPPALSAPTYYSRPPVVTPHGLLNEALAAVLPLHSEDGSIDAQVAAQFTQGSPHAVELPPLETHRPPPLTRPYSYGTDTAFNSSGYAAPVPNAEDIATERLLRDLRGAQDLVSLPGPRKSPNKPQRPISPTYLVGLEEIPSDADRHSESETSGDDESDSRPTKKRRKANHAPTTKPSNGHRKPTSTARPAKIRKTSSVDDRVSKTKRLSAAGQKAQRENLTEEQKRSNHILSEQKRRNLIKRGFDDLHELVPEIRSGGLSKSGVLTEAAAFLEKLITENREFRAIIAAGDG